jgi:hypothetical protein
MTEEQMTEERQTNPFVFIVGSPRSGTTLLERIVDAHPEVAVFHEMRWIVRWYRRRTGLTPDGFVTPELISYLLGYSRFRKRLQMSQERLEELLPKLVETLEPVSYARFMSGVFDLYGEAQGKRLVGDKTPKYARHIRTLHDLWPEAKFVHLIRDGRDVCLSIMDWERIERRAIGRSATWARDPVSTAALWWKWFVGLGREDGGPLEPELYHEVRYESLVANPVDECVALCEFLGVPYDGAMVRFAEGRTMTNPAFDAKQAWLPVTPGLRNWRSQMPAEDVERFEAVAGDLLEELGYPRAFPTPSSEALERVSKIRKSFTQDVRTQGHRLPEGW